MRLFITITVVLLLHIFVLWLFFRNDSPPEQPDEREERQEHVDEEKIDRQVSPEDRPRPGDTMNYEGFSRPSLSLSGDAANLVDNCETGLLIDLTGRRILWEKNGGKSVPIASMVKMMTVLLMMEAVEENPDLSLQTEVEVTRDAAAIGGRQVWLDPRESFTLDELLKIIMMHSANDAAYLLGEFIGQGDVEHFVDMMNRRARELGFEDAEFVNPHGLDTRQDGPVNRATARELAWLASRLLEYPRVVHWASTWHSSIRDDDPRFSRFELVNTNRLVRSYQGVNGMKTGYTGLAGFCLTATCERNRQVLIAVVTGCESSDQRNQLVEALFDWGWEQ